MREIKLPIQYIITLPPQREVEVFSVLAEIKDAHRNGSKVISAALSIEREMENEIAHYFFAGEPEKNLVFQGMVLGTDWCSLNAKRRMLFQIIGERDYLVGEEKADFETDLSRLNRFRNAFAHGLVTGDDTALVLKFYEGGPKEQPLNEEFWAGIETFFVRLFKTMENIAYKSGRLKKRESSQDEIA